MEKAVEELSYLFNQQNRENSLSRSKDLSITESKIAEWQKLMEGKYFGTQDVKKNFTHLTNEIQQLKTENIEKMNRYFQNMNLLQKENGIIMTKFDGILNEIRQIKFDLIHKEKLDINPHVIRAIQSSVSGIPINKEFIFERKHLKPSIELKNQLITKSNFKYFHTFTRENPSLARPIKSFLSPENAQSNHRIKIFVQPSKKSHHRDYGNSLKSRKDLINLRKTETASNIYWETSRRSNID